MERERERGLNRESLLWEKPERSLACRRGTGSDRGHQRGQAGRGQDTDSGVGGGGGGGGSSEDQGRGTEGLQWCELTGLWAVQREK